MYLAHASAQGWPTQLNFCLLPNCIKAMELELHQLIYDEDTLECSHIWQTLKTDTMTLREFTKSPTLQAKLSEQAWPG
jgi:hypothetical protein